MASQLGKRYKCEVCGTEILCIKAGAGPVTCCGKEVKSSEAKPIRVTSRGWRSRRRRLGSPGSIRQIWKRSSKASWARKARFRQ